MDLRWLDDLDPFGTETADAEEELRQDLYHVIEQDQDSNLDDPTRGLGAANILSDTIPSDFVATVEAELMQDDRVATATAKLAIDDSGGPGATIATLEIEIEPRDDLLEQLNLTVPLGTSTTPADA